MISRSTRMKRVMDNILRLERSCAAYSGDPGSLTWALALTGDIQRELIQQELCDTEDLYGNQTHLNQESH